MTNGERADRLIREARQIAGEMRRALGDEAWNLAEELLRRLRRTT